MNRSLALATAVAGLAGLAPGSIPPAAAAAATCQLYAEQPYYNSSIVAIASWSGCPAGARFTVVLREDRRWWADRTIRSGSGSGGYGAKTLTYPCGTDFDPIKVFVEIRYGDRKVHSPRAILPCA